MQRGHVLLALFVALLALGGVAVWLFVGGIGEPTLPSHETATSAPRAKHPDGPSSVARTDELLTPRPAAEAVPITTNSPNSPEPHRVDPLSNVGVPVRIVARVVDSTGAPRSGARAVWLPNTDTLTAAGLSPHTWGRWPDSAAAAGSLAGLPQTTTGEDGRVTLDTRHVPMAGEGDWWDQSSMPTPAVVFVCDGWTTRVMSVTELKAGSRDLGDVALEPEAIVTGRAVDDDGRALAGARVRVESQQIQPQLVKESSIWQGGFVPDLMQQATAEDGRFTLTGLWQGRTQLEFMAPARVRVRLEVEARGGEVLDLGDVLVSRGSAIAGRVVDAAGAPIPKAKVSVVDGEIRGGLMGDMGYGYDDDDDSIHDELFQAEDNGRHPSVFSDAAGDFRVSGLDSPQLSVYATAAGFEPGRFRPVSPGDSELRLVLQREATLRIAVIDKATRAPVPDAVLRVIRESGVESGTGDADLVVESSGPGAFVAHGAGPRLQRVFASAPGRAGASVEGPGIAPGQTAELTVELGPEAVIAGRVVDAQGQPRNDATIEVLGPGNFRMPLLSVPADATGAFRIERLGTISVDLVAFAPGAADSTPLRVELQEGQRREDLEIRLLAPARIHGTVTRDDGAPDTKALVGLDVQPYGEFKFIETSERFVFWMRADEQGHYAFEALRPGEYQVEANGHATVVCTLAEGEDRLLDFTANAGVRVHGRVTSGGQPVAGVHVTASNDPADSRQRLGWVQPAVTDAAGDYELRLKVAGEMEIYVDPRGSPESEHRAIVSTPGQDVTVDLELPSGHIAGRVVDDVTGAPIAGLDISLNRDVNLSAAYCSTADDGSFRLDWLPPDSYRLRLPGFGSYERRRARIILPLEPRDIVLAAGEAIDEVSLTACRGATLSGDVRLPDGGSVKDGLAVMLVHTSSGSIVPGVSAVWASGGDRGEGMRYEESKDPIWARCSTEGGRYEFIALPAGEYRVLTGTATAEEIRDLGQPATLDEHEALEIDLIAR